MDIYAASYLIPMNGKPLAGGAIAVENGVIVSVGSLNDLKKQFNAPVSDFPGSVLLPGLVNAHTHLELTHFPVWHTKSASGTQSYVDWIKQVISLKRTLTLESLEESLQSGINNVLETGTTMVGDILSDRRLLPQYNGSHLSGRVYLEYIGQAPEKYTALLDNINNEVFAIPDNFLPGLSPHAPFTVSKSLVRVLHAKAKTLNVPIAMHLAESPDEVSFFNDSTGRIADDLFPFVGWHDYLPEPLATTSTLWLESTGILSENFLGIHGVHLAKADIKALKSNAASIVLVARSNHNLGVGNAPVKELLAAGIPLAIGTDSLASVETLSLWDEMRFLLDSFPGCFTPQRLLQMATLGGAKAIKCDNFAGSLEPGKNADFILLQISQKSYGDQLYERILGDTVVQGVWCKGKRVEIESV